MARHSSSPIWGKEERSARRPRGRGGLVLRRGSHPLCSALSKAAVRFKAPRRAACTESLRREGGSEPSQRARSTRLSLPVTCRASLCCAQKKAPPLAISPYEAAEMHPGARQVRCLRSASAGRRWVAQRRGGPRRGPKDAARSHPKPTHSNRCMLLEAAVRWRRQRVGRGEPGRE